MKKLLFLAPYPTKDSEKEGMMSRIKCIDNLFKEKKRVYLNVFIRNQAEKKCEKDNAIIYDLNLFKSFILIIKIIFSSDIIYCHSIYSLRFIWPILLIRNNCKLILDIHGVIPDEKIFFYNKKIQGFCFKLIEYFVFHRINYAICVTNSMKKVYENRYKFAKCNYIVYSILPIELSTTEFILNSDVNVDDTVEVIYCGGMQQWQNIDLMLDVINKNLLGKVHYTILTGNVKEMKEKIQLLNINNENVEITTCPSNELIKYYAKAHYAFILRDTSVVNQVANPTKLVEYLFYGLVPIVLSPSIGDYQELNYEYINVSDFDSRKILPRKSTVNRNIALKLLKNNCEMNLANLVLKD